MNLINMSLLIERSSSVAASFQALQKKRWEVVKADMHIPAYMHWMCARLPA
jgi:hypothetical protein